MIDSLPELNVVHCADAHDFLAGLPDESVDMIFTDPPYHRDAVPLYEMLLAEAVRVLKPGRLALVYAGYAFLPRILNFMPPGMEWFWAFVLRHGGGWNRYWVKQVLCSSKLVLAFSRGKPRLLHWVPGDFQESGARKANHPWEQNPEFALRYIPAFTEPGETVCDPFAGSGTFLVASQQWGRNFFACEIDPDMAHTANDRLAATAKGLTLREYREGQGTLLWPSKP